MKRMQTLDGLRGVLAVYVMISHMAPFTAAPAWLLHPLSHGMAAVDVFFILSGMVIPLSLEGSGYRAVPFLAARVRRIFPVFLAVFLVSMAIQPIRIDYAAMPWIAPDSLAWRMWADGWPSDWAGNIAAHLTMTHGLFPDGAWPHVYLGYLGAAWSLSTEWQFYLLMVLAARPGREWSLAWGLIALAALALAWTELAPEPWRFSRAFLPNKAHFFALGIASAAMLRGTLSIRVRRMRFAAILAGTSAWPADRANWRRPWSGRSASARKCGPHLGSRRFRRCCARGSCFGWAPSRTASISSTSRSRSCSAWAWHDWRTATAAFSPRFGCRSRRCCRLPAPGGCTGRSSNPCWSMANGTQGPGAAMKPICPNCTLP